MSTAVATQAAPNQLAEAYRLLAQWADEKPTGLYSRRRVIDHLLDLRNALPARHRRVVDLVLADVPGVTVVEAEWWVQRVAVFSAYLEHPVST